MVPGSVPMLELGTLPNSGSAQLPRTNSGQYSWPSSIFTKRAGKIKRNLCVVEENRGRNEGCPTGWQHVVRKGGANWVTVRTGKSGTRGKKRCHEEHGDLAGQRHNPAAK
jgi:hypothetical protein